MKITLNEPGLPLELEAKKVDTSTGAGWSVGKQTGKKTIITCLNGNWNAIDSNISHDFWQTIGNEINLSLAIERVNKLTGYLSENIRPEKETNI